MSRRLAQGLFFAVCAICALSIAVIAIGLSKQSEATCKAANRALAGELKVWQRVEIATKAEWAKRPTPQTERDRTNAFFAGVKKDLKPERC